MQRVDLRRQKMQKLTRIFINKGNIAASEDIMPNRVQVVKGTIYDQLTSYRPREVPSWANSVKSTIKGAIDLKLHIKRHLTRKMVTCAADLQNGTFIIN